jgi:hypothetical protein
MGQTSSRRERLRVSLRGEETSSSGRADQRESFRRARGEREGGKAKAGTHSEREGRGVLADREEESKLLPSGSNGESRRGEGRRLVQGGANVMVFVEHSHDLAGEVERHDSVATNSFVGSVEWTGSGGPSRVRLHPPREHHREAVQQPPAPCSRGDKSRGGGVGRVYWSSRNRRGGRSSTTCTSSTSIWLLVEVAVHLVGPLDRLLHGVDINPYRRRHDRLKVLLTTAGHESLERDMSEGPPGMPHEGTDPTETAPQPLVESDVEETREDVQTLRGDELSIGTVLVERDDERGGESLLVERTSGVVLRGGVEVSGERVM